MQDLFKSYNNFKSAEKCKQVEFHSIGATIGTCHESWCLPYTGFKKKVNLGLIIILSRAASPTFLIKNCGKGWGGKNCRKLVLRFPTFCNSDIVFDLEWRKAVRLSLFYDLMHH